MQDIGELMPKTRIVHQLTVATAELPPDTEVDICDLQKLLYKKYGKISWSGNEISGAMPKLKDIFSPTGNVNRNGLKTYMKKEQEDE